MGLSRVRLGDLLSRSDVRNTDGSYELSSVRGLSVDKVFISTKADMRGVSLSPYKLVAPDSFAYVTVTSRNSDKLTLAHNDSEETYLVSSSYEVFSVCATDQLDSRYLFMVINRPEFDRYARFNSWGSAREIFSWEDFCDIEIAVPPIEVQRKYVAIYEAMLANQRAYEQGLDDLKLSCDALLDQCKKTERWEPVRKHLVEVDVRNGDGACDTAYGINIKKEFMVSKASSDDLLKYKIVEPGQLAYSAMQTGRDKCIRIALNESDERITVSPAYSILRTVDDGVDARYLMMWFTRAESDRYGWFLSDASIRANLDLNRFMEIEIPIADEFMRDALCELYTVLRLRSAVNDRLKDQLKDICPILIRGSIEEALKQS